MKILYAADKNSAMRPLIEQFFYQEGHTYNSVCSMDELAAHLSETEKYDLLVIARRWNMYTAIEALRLIRAGSLLAGIPILACGSKKFQPDVEALGAVLVDITNDMDELRQAIRIATTIHLSKESQ